MADTKTTTTISEELKTAAATLRETAAKATRGPWVPYPTTTADQHDEAWTISRTWCSETEGTCEPDCGQKVLSTGAEGCEEDNIREGDVSWICLTNPLLAEPLAAWLTFEAAIFEQIDPDRQGACVPEHALRIARVINGTTPQERGDRG
ncbi:hypothetical protein ACBJ59_36390 [Nonomuraea sp. MTCD27]|uniref:hypothetical protein n=1 Tax=Nonomuraea sp. MTCD27 TaxID=1676747 RepID=UPI0035BF9089